MDRFYRCWAGAAFGMEGLVSAELRRLGASGVRAENGGVLFEASPEELFEFNLRMHFCDRLFIVLSDSVCKSFEDLFQAVLGIDWRPFFSGNEAINVSCKCTRSVLMSPRDCQSVAKKAIIESLRRSSGQKVFPELIEAAFMASRRAPGLCRSFAMEELPLLSPGVMEDIRHTLRAEVKPEAVCGISGSDLDPEALVLARRHVAQAGLRPDSIPLSCLPLQELQLESAGGVFLCNPPYGERLSDQKSCRLLYRDLHALRDRHPSWSLCALSSDPAFERSYGQKASRKRRLYNGRLECVFYCFD